MKKHIPYAKLSKKEKHRVDSAVRRLWSDYGLNSPVTKVAADKKKEARRTACRGNSGMMEDR